MFRFYKEMLKPIDPKEEFIRDFSLLLKQYIKYHNNEEKSIFLLSQAFIKREVSVDEQVIDAQILSNKSSIDKAMQGENALWASEAIAKLLEELLNRHPTQFRGRPVQRTLNYVLDKLTDGILCVTSNFLPDMIVWVYNSTLKKNHDTFAATKFLFDFTDQDFKQLQAILKIFTIDKIGMGFMCDKFDTYDQNKWTAFLSLLSMMKVVHLKYPRNLKWLNKTRFAELATALKAAKVIHILGCNFLPMGDVEKYEAGVCLEQFICALLESSNLTVLNLAGFDELFSHYFSSSQKESVSKKLAASNVVSLKLCNVLLGSDLSDLADDDKKLIEGIIANNNRRAALSIENGGLKRLVAYSIWNNTKTSQLYADNIFAKREDSHGQRPIPAELREAVNSLNKHGLVGERLFPKKLVKEMNSVLIEDAYKPKI